MSTESRILMEKSDHVALVTIDHPPVNALNLETAQQFEAVVNQLEADDEVRAVILTGAGEKSFSAGFDVSDAANGPAIGSLVRALWTRLDRFPKPLIAALNGHALGGGLELALCCHFRLAADRPGIKIGLTELNLGLIPGWGGTQRLARWVGHRTAVEMILLSQVLSPQEAQGAQLVNQVVPPDQLIAQAGELAGRLAQRPPQAMGHLLQVMAQGLYEGLPAGLAAEEAALKAMRGGKERAQGFADFLDKDKGKG